MTTDTQIDVAGLPASTESEVVKPTELDTPTETAAAGEVEEKQDESAKKFKPIESQEDFDTAIQKRLAKKEREVLRNVQREQAEVAQRARTEQAPRRDNFQDNNDYIQAQIEHRAEIRAAEKIAEREYAKEATARSESFADKAEKVSDRYADFNEVVSNPSLKINDAMAEFITGSENGAELAYYLGKNPNKAAQISGMSVVKATMELMNIDSELKSKTAVKTSTAPAPIVPVGSKGRTSTSLANADFADYKKQREAGGAKWSR